MLKRSVTWRETEPYTQRRSWDVRGSLKSIRTSNSPLHPATVLFSFIGPVHSGLSLYLVLFCFAFALLPLHGIEKSRSWLLFPVSLSALRQKTRIKNRAHSTPLLNFNLVFRGSGSMYPPVARHVSLFLPPAPPTPPPVPVPV